MRVVLDTNVLVSAFLWTGTPARILPLARKGEIELCTTKEILDEFQAVLEYPKFARRLRLIGKTPVLVLEEYVDMAESYPSLYLPQLYVPDDPSDDIFLACALAANAASIVSGARHLLKLREFAGIPIVTPAQFLRRSRKKK